MSPLNTPSATLEVRRHAERATGTDAPDGLSTRGLTMAGRLRRESAFALVVSSPRGRARATALAIAGRVDEIEPLLGGSPDEALTQTQYDTMRSQEAVAELLRTSTPSLRFAEGQLAVWGRIAMRLADGTALVITHGGNIELPATMLATELGASIEPLPLTFCEGVRIRYEGGLPVALERLRAQ